MVLKHAVWFQCTSPYRAGNFNLLSSIQDRLIKKGQSMALISLDITGAFDRAWNPAILYVNAFTAYTVSNLSTKIHTEF